MAHKVQFFTPRGRDCTAASYEIGRKEIRLKHGLAFDTGNVVRIQYFI